MIGAPRYFAESAIEIAASPAAVWALLADFHGVNKWARDVKVQPLGSAMTGRGTGRRCEIKGLGVVDEFVIEWEPERRLSYSVSPISVFKHAANHWRIEPARRQNTRAMMRFEYDMRFGFIGGLLQSLVVKRKLAAIQPNVLKQLKMKAESCGTI